jgi:hypothetical protein
MLATFQVSNVYRLGRTQNEGRASARFKTIQVCPKDLPAALRQAELAVTRPNGPVGA